jgi:2-methylisocitrate lyase-like PEP mutase family enzyme
MSPQSHRVSRFGELHRAGCFVIPNPWDVGSARLLERLGFDALATASAGFAWSRGVPDNQLSLEEVLAHLRDISAAVDLPVNADFESGFAVEPAALATNVALATETGIAGLSIEDSTGEAAAPLHAFELSVARIAAARRAIDASGSGVLLTARSEGYLVGRPDLRETIRRLTAFAKSGADCVYAPGLRSLHDIRAVVDAVAPTPVNVLVSGDFTNVAELSSLGVRRVSVGGALARTALTGFMTAAREIQETGTFGAFATTLAPIDINGLLAPTSR